MTSNPEDMRHIFSYDIIMDGIRTIVARGHVELSETLAEQVAAHVLEDPRVVRVTVRVQKLELGAGRRRRRDRTQARRASKPGRLGRTSAGLRRRQERFPAAARRASAR